MLIRMCYKHRKRHIVIVTRTITMLKNIVLCINTAADICVKIISWRERKV